MTEQNGDALPPKTKLLCLLTCKNFQLLSGKLIQRLRYPMDVFPSTRWIGAIKKEEIPSFKMNYPPHLVCIDAPFTDQFPAR